MKISRKKRRLQAKNNSRQGPRKKASYHFGGIVILSGGQSPTPVYGEIDPASLISHGQLIAASPT